MFAHTGAETPFWPYLAFGWAFLATLVPVALGRPKSSDLPGVLLTTTLFTATPFSIAAAMLVDGPHHILSLGCIAVTALWMLALFWIIPSIIVSRRHKQE